MIPIIVFAVVGLLLFAGAFISKRRFGLLGLALTAGASLSSLWGYDAGLLVQAFGILRDGAVSQAVAQSLLVVLPAVLLLFHGYAYKNKVARVFGSFFFAVLALAFLIEPLGHVMPLTGTGVEVFNFFRANQALIMGIGIVLSIVDLFFTKPVQKLASKK